MFWQQVVNGLVQGCIYALGALGYALIYGVIRLVQFAHGDVMMVACYCGYMFLGMFVVTVFDIPVIGALLAGLIGGALLGLIIERIAFRPLRFAPAVASSMASMGIALLLRDGARLVMGPQMRRFTETSLGMQSIDIGDVKISILQLAVVSVSVLLMVSLQLLLYRTRFGLAIRAVAQNPLGADYVGIDSNRVIPLAFALGSGVAGVSGVLIGLYYNVVWPTFGFTGALRAFSATVLGGLSSIGGSVVGGIILGLAENLGSGYLGEAYRDIIAFLVLFLVLVIRPAGLFGSRP